MASQAETYCMMRNTEGRLCHARIPTTERLCTDCKKRAHINGCPNPNAECTCGFSKLFWADVEAKTRPGR